ncbi:hypothetical protein [Profundibacter sp.]|uniref:hypothetical protein n=1 Tax=Profundibacter sp. TaxID=3101071 RepID=UPI003D0E1D4D
MNRLSHKSIHLNNWSEFPRPPLTVLPCAETVPMLLWALMASGQIVMRKVDGWETLAQPVADATLDQAA